MRLRAISWFFWFALGANAAPAFEVELAYIGDPADAVYSGVSQGLEEANLQGQFLGQRYRLTSFEPKEFDRAPSSQAAVLLAALEDSELVKLGERTPGRAVFDLGSGSDALRQRCLPNLLHILPSTRMKADALAQWQRLHPGSRAQVQAWHPDFTKYAAEQLNRRYRKAQGRDMDDRAWAGWAAVKMVADSVARLGTAEATPLLDYLKTALAFDGQKGVTMSFRKNGQLRQMLLIVEGPRIVGEAPVKGVVHPTDLDSRGPSIVRHRDETKRMRNQFLLIAALAAGTAAAEPTHRVFVTNERGDSITVIDSRTLEVEATVPVGKHPRGIGLAPDGTEIYVALGKENAIAVFDPKTLKVLRKIPSGDDPEAFAVHPNGHIYLSNEDAAKATVLDPKSGKVIAEIPVGLEPEGVAISPDGKQVIVTSESTNMLHVIAVPEHQVVANILVGARPRAAVFRKDGTIAYATSEISGEVKRVDMVKHHVLNKVPLGDDSIKPKDILVSRDGTTLYVAGGRANQVIVLDEKTLGTKARIPVGQRVWGLAMSQDGSRIYTTDGASNTVSVIDTAKNQVLNTIKVGEAPWGVIIDDRS